MISFVNTGMDEAILKSMPTDGCSEDLVKAMSKQGLVQKEITVQGKNGKTFTRKQWVKASDAKDTGTSQKSANSDGFTESGDGSYTKPLVITRGSESYQIWAEGSHIKGSMPGKQDSHNVRDIKDFTQNGFDKFDEVKDYVKKYFFSKSDSSDNKSGDTTKSSEISFDKPADGDTKKALSQMLASGKSRQDIMSAAKSAGITWKENDHEGINWMRASMAIQKHMNESKSVSIDFTNKDNKKDDKTNKTKSLSISELTNLLIDGMDDQYDFINLDKKEQDKVITKIADDEGINPDDMLNLMDAGLDMGEYTLMREGAHINDSRVQNIVTDYISNLTVQEDVDPDDVVEYIRENYTDGLPLTNGTYNSVEQYVKESNNKVSGGGQMTKRK